jgi:diguanylate cyclase (GGDEF)-like protein/PAS domain S-box-containing protein
MSRNAVAHASAPLSGADTRAQYAVHRSEHERDLLAALPIAMIETDSEGICINLNPAALALLGVEYAAAIGENISTLLGDDVELHIEGRSPDSDIIRVDALRLFPAQGDERVVEFSATSLESSDQPTVVYFLRDITEEVALEKQLRDNALRDPLTGLPNRHAVEERLDLTLRQIERGAPPAVLCFLDLDNFKQINDRCGHGAGDALLKSIGDIFRQRVRATDVVGRIGGDEFVILLNGCAMGDAFRYLQALQGQLRILECTCQGRTVKVGLSAGLNLITKKTQSIGDALAAADSACFAAKCAGRNQIRVCSGNPLFPPARATSEIGILDTLEAFLLSGTIPLFAQPLRDLRPNCAREQPAEVLLRPKDSNGRRIPTAQLLLVASRYGLAPQLDRLVIRQVADWLFDGEPHARCQRFYVNLTGSSIVDDAFVDWLQRNVSASIAPFLGFELTEADLLLHPDAAHRFITAAHTLGCSVAIDQVSGALDAISSLLNLSASLIKLHPNFSKMTTSHDPAYIQAEALVRIAHQASSALAITHLETEEALRCAERLGADFAQGVAVSPALPLIEAQPPSAVTGDGYARNS